MQTKITLILVISGMMFGWVFTNFLLVIPTIFTGLQDILLNESVNIIDLLSVLNVVGFPFVVSLFIVFMDNFEGEISPIKSDVALGLTLVAVFLTIAGIGRIFLLSLDSDVSLAATNLLVNDTGICAINDCLLTMRWSSIPSLILFPTIIIAGIWAYQGLSKSVKFQIDSYQNLKKN